VDSVPLEALECEWRTLVHGQLGVEFRRWCRVEPVLARFGGPGRMLAFLWDERGSSAGQDSVLAALLRLAPREPLAARVVLQALLPGLKKHAGQLLRRRADRGKGALERDELWQVLFVSLLARIQSYPLAARPARIASNLLLDTVHVTLAELATTRQALLELPAAEPLEPTAPPTVPEDVDALLLRAVRAGAIRGADAELIAETEIEGVGLEVVAERLGVSYNAVKVRRQRAERRLLKFLSKEAEIPSIQMDPKSRSKRPTSSAYAAETDHSTGGDGRDPAVDQASDAIDAGALSFQSN
jgi:DNA-directed RNA polymerase specialized sigma24 family protein